MKIYNEIVIDMNPESSSYGETLYEDSFEHKGDLMLLQNCNQACAEACQDPDSNSCGQCHHYCEQQNDDTGNNDQAGNNDQGGQDAGGNQPEGDVICYDGSTAPSYDQCPTPGFDMPDEVGIGTDDWHTPAWYDDPSTSGGGYEDNEFAHYIFENLYGGTSETGAASGQEWWNKYGWMFPEWEGTTEYQQYLSTLEEYGLTEEDERILSEGYNKNIEGNALQYLTTMEAVDKGAMDNLPFQIENQFITSGTMSGRGVAAAEQLTERSNADLTTALTGLHLERDLLDLVYEGDLYDIEEQRLGYEQDLLGIESAYEANLALIHERHPLLEGGDPCPDGSLCWNGMCNTSYQGNECPYQPGTGSCVEQCMHNSPDKSLSDCEWDCRADDEISSESEFEGFDENELHDEWDTQGDYDEYDWDEGGWGT